MKYIKLVITCKQPIKVSAALNGMGIGETLDYIPGSLIRGAFISNYIKQTGIKDIDKNDESIEWFFNNKLEFLNGYIESKGERTLPIPQGLYSEAIDILKYNAGNEISVKNELKDKIEDTDKKITGNNYLCSIENLNEIVSVEKVENLHITTGEDKNMFRYEAIKEKQKFISYIKCDLSEADTTKVKEIIENGEFYFGGSKGSGYGKVTIKVKEICDENPEYCKGDYKNEFIIYTLSDGIFMDNLGVVNGYIPQEFLKSELNLENVKLESVSTETVLIGGYNNKWKCRLPQYKGNKAGSLFRYSFKGILRKEDVIKLMDKGIGLRTEDGYGRIMFIDNINITTIKKYKKDNTYKKPKVNITDRDKKQLQLFVDSMCKVKIKESIQKRILKSYSSRSKVNTNQIGKLINLFETAQGLEKDKGVELINKYINHLYKTKDDKNRENTNYQLRDLKVDNKSAEEFINNEIKVINNRELFYSQYDLHNISVKGIEPKLSDEEIYVYKMIELEETFKYVLRREQYGIKK